MSARKILYSPGFGAGWSSWCGYGGDARPDLADFMLTYQPIIDAVERGEDVSVRLIGGVIGGRDDMEAAHPAMRSFVEECQSRFGEVPYLGGARALCVFTVPDGARFRIDEYDGSETVRLDIHEEWK